MLDADERASTRHRRLWRLCAAGTGLFASLSLGGWIAGAIGLAQWNTGSVPMAPSTAIICLLLTIGMLGRESEPGHPRATIRVAASVAAYLALLISALFLVTILAGVCNKLEHLLLDRPASMHGFETGHISPVSAIILLLASLALCLLLSLPPGLESATSPVWVHFRRRASVACSLALVTLACGGVILLGYLYGTPLLYGGTVTPVALPTAAAITLLGAGLLTAAGPNPWPACLLSGPSVGARLARALLPVLFLLIVLGNWVALNLLYPRMNPVLGVAIRTVVATIAVSIVIVIVSRSVGRQIEHAETEMRGSEERFRAFYENSPLPFHSLDSEGRFIEVNEAFLDTLGYSREEIIGQWAGQIMRPEVASRFEAEFAEYKKHGRVQSRDYEFVRKDGTWLHATLNARLDRSPEGQFRKDYCFWSDITELQRAKSALADAKAAAEDASRAKDRLLSVVSHELRTPLTPVLMTLCMLEEDPKTPVALRGDLAMMRQRIELEAKLIDGLLDLTRGRRGKTPPKCERVDVHVLVERVIALSMSDSDAVMARLHRDLQARRATAWTDGIRLQQVLWNIVNNALQYTPASGSIWIRSRDLDGEELELQVADTGAGIEADFLPRVFNEFERGNHALASRSGGLGLGLAIAKSLIEQLGGTITAASEGSGKGATFTVRLPLGSGGNPVASTPAVTNAPARAAPSGPKGSSESSLRILLVEDDADTADTLGRALKALGHNVHTARTVQEALAAGEHERFDLLLSDLGLPDGSGADVMRRLRKCQFMPGIALSGYAAPADLERSQAAGFTMHLIKPVAIEALRASIQECLRSHLVAK